MTEGPVNITAEDLDATELECTACQWRPANAMKWRKLGTPCCPQCGNARLVPAAPKVVGRTAWEKLLDED